MSDPKVEVARDIARLFSAGDMDGLGAHFHADAVLFPPEGWPEGGPMRGRDAIVSQFERLIEGYSQQRAELSDLVAEGAWLVGFNRWETRARYSGIEATLDLWFATRFEGRLVVELHYRWTKEDAMQAAGISA